MVIVNRYSDGSAILTDVTSENCNTYTHKNLYRYLITLTYRVRQNVNLFK